MGELLHLGNHQSRTAAWGRTGIAKGKECAQGAVGKFVAAIEVLPISEGIELFAREKARLTCQGLPIEDFDLLIACTAIAHNCILVSENLKHMDRIEGLRAENWVER